jgi:hypothetical protein
MLIDQNLDVFYYEKAEMFRKEHLWSNSVAAVFKTNQNLIQQIFTKFSKGKKFVSIEAVYEIVKHINKLDGDQTTMAKGEFNLLYAMSKQLVVEESTKGI